MMKIRIRELPVLLLLTLLASCATVTPTNQPIREVDETEGYRPVTTGFTRQTGNTIVLLAFSGGGTRAASLSYGVMQELRDTYIQRDGELVRLLDEVDSISSVSGGSFTSAYYGIYRDKIFEDYETDFLRRDVQSTLIRKLFNPGYWFTSMFSGFDRTEMAIDYYDRMVFRGATFADMAANGPPYIDINATDLTTGMRFTFSQNLFDFICSDLSQMKVARAVTASSAVPVAFPTIMLKNHADQCDLEGTREWEIINRSEGLTESQQDFAENILSYRDIEKRKYIHLVDGGISDNLGLRATLDRVGALGDERFKRLADGNVDSILIILVNAAVDRESFMEQEPKKPGASTTINAFIDSQIKRYDTETKERVRDRVERFRERARAADVDIDIYFSEVTFDHVQESDASSFLNNMPTTLELDDNEVDALIASGRLLLRNEPSFVAFKEDKNARLSPDAMAERSLCRFFDHPMCHN